MMFALAPGRDEFSTTDNRLFGSVYKGENLAVIDIWRDVLQRYILCAEYIVL